MAVGSVGPDAAAGLTRGWAPKPYAYTDPNEDVVAVVVGRHATLLVAADGHSGEQASLVAVDLVLERFGDDPPADVDPETLIGLFAEADAAVFKAALTQPPRSRDSATTLVVAFVARGHVAWGSVGDSVAVAAAPGATRMLGTVSRRYLGQTMPGGAGAVAPFVSAGRIGVPPGTWIVLATDGYSDWAPSGGDLARATGLWTAAASTADEVVGRLMDQARVGGAGDNVGIAVARAPS